MDPAITTKIHNFFGQYKLRRFSKGHILIRAEENPKFIYHLFTGQVKQYDISDRGAEIVVHTYKPPAFIPMSYAINKTPNQYFFETINEVTLRQAPVDETLKFFKNNPDVAYDLLGRLYVGVDGLLRRMAHLMGGSARSRVLYEIITECRGGGVLQKARTYFLDLHEEELARRAGLSRETVCRELNKIKRQGYISVARKRIEINDLASLERELGSRL